MANLERTYSVLVVDDDKNINKLISDTLKLDKVYEVTSVMNGEACLKYLRENRHHEAKYNSKKLEEHKMTTKSKSLYRVNSSDLEERVEFILDRSYNHK